jgi:hypothetical protein
MGEHTLSALFGEAPSPGATKHEICRHIDVDCVYVVEDHDPGPVPICDIHGSVQKVEDNGTGRVINNFNRIETELLSKRTDELYAYESPVELIVRNQAQLIVRNQARDLLLAEARLFRPQLDAAVEHTKQTFTAGDRFSTEHLDQTRKQAGMEASYALAHPKLKRTLVKRGAYECIAEGNWHYHPGVGEDEVFVFHNGGRSNNGVYRVLEGPRFFLATTRAGEVAWQSYMVAGIQLFDVRNVARYVFHKEE